MVHLLLEAANSHPSRTPSTNTEQLLIETNALPLRQSDTYVQCEPKHTVTCVTLLNNFNKPSLISATLVQRVLLGRPTIVKIYTVSKKTSPMFLAITRESIVGFS